MKRKTFTIVGIIFEDELQDIVDCLLEKNLLSTTDIKKLNEGQDISIIYKNVMDAKNIKNYPLLEIIAPEVNCYYLGYRIDQTTTEQEIKKQIKKAQNSWLKLFGEVPLTESIGVDVY